MSAKLQKRGNSQGVRISKHFPSLASLKEGDEIEIIAEDDCDSSPSNSKKILFKHFLPNIRRMIILPRSIRVNLLKRKNGEKE